MTDPRIAQYERERADAIEIAHRAMATSYIGAPPANLRGDADRMVAALLKAGWTPPSETVVEHAIGVTDGSKQVRPNDPQIDRIWPLADWIPAHQRFGGKVYRRRVIVVEDWSEVPRG